MRAGVERSKNERKREEEREKKMRREKNEREKFPGTSISLKSAQRERGAAVPVVQMATPNARARSLKENIFIKFMRPRVGDPRAPRLIGFPRTLINFA